jgi:type 2 lantibiotic biosynthesis protein LanM
MSSETKKGKDTMAEQILSHLSSDWYRSLTLQERTLLLRTVQEENEKSLPFDKELALRRIQKWLEQKYFQEHDEEFALYLKSYDLNKHDLERILGESEEELIRRSTSQPAWLQTLIEIHEANYPCALPQLAERFQTPQRIAGFSLLHPIAPLIRWGLEQLQGVSCSCANNPGNRTSINASSLTELFYPTLIAQLLPKMTKVITLEMHIVRIQKHLQGETPEERFATFLQRFRSSRETLELLLLYPVLARELVVTIEIWVQRCHEIVHRLFHDWEEIQQTFFHGISPGELVAIDMGSGDLHQSGQSVAILSFAQGEYLVYKPRSLAIEACFQKFLLLLNSQQQAIQFSSYQVLERSAYGWTTFIRSKACDSEGEMKWFYERLGGYLAILHVLNATDFHFENLIAAGEYPVLIDLETLFHPQQHNKDKQRGEKRSAPGTRMMERSVLRINLLPQRIWMAQNEGGVDISGIGGRGGQVSSREYSVLTDIGTDTMRMQRQKVVLPGKQNRPTLQGSDMPLKRYLDHIIIGFRQMYQHIWSRQEEIGRFIHTHFAGVPIRVIIRPTQLYARLLDESYHPHVLRDALHRDRLYCHLWGRDTACHEQIVIAERGDLHTGNIPYFTTETSSRDITTTQGICIANVLEESGLELFQERLQTLSDSDLEQQLWYIKTSFAINPEEDDQPTWRSSQLEPTPRPYTQNDLIEVACSIGERLHTLAIHDQEGAYWAGLNLLGTHNWVVAPTGSDLYAGVSGIALFLAYLGEVSKQDTYIRLAERACQFLEASVAYMSEAEEKMIGAFSSWGSLVYLYTHLGTLWHDPVWWQRATLYSAKIECSIQDDHAFDIISGAAGAICCLLNLYQVAPSQPVLRTAIRCGDHLLAHATPMDVGCGWKTSLNPAQPLAGFSHGNAGIAYSLMRLARISGEERFQQTARQAITYEDSLFSEERQNWPDLRILEQRGDVFQTTTTDTHVYTSTWCHGAPGIALSRLALASLVEYADPNLRSKIEPALVTTLKHGFGLNHSLCHGDTGNLETILQASQILKDPFYTDALEHITAMLVESIKTQGCCTGVPSNVEVPGLMTGIAGIGYQLLRLAYPQQIPSVLLLDPPTPGL